MTPEQYRSHVDSRSRRVVVDQATSEVLIISTSKRTIVRFDVLRCELLGDLDGLDGRWEDVRGNLQ